jgi:cellulose synthase (UDP-forming)
MKNLETRLVGIITIIAGANYIRWLIQSLNLDVPILSAIFLFVAIFGVASSILLVINNWGWSIPTRSRLKKEKKVAIIIPTWKEPIGMVERTIRSVLTQNYSTKNITLILSDDSSNPQMQTMLFSLKNQFKDAKLIYNIPPKKGSGERAGEGKAGNLNSALKLVPHDIEYIETRDADDLVGDSNFLKTTVARLEAEEKLAFVQTIKEVNTPKGDPFGNKESLFYRSLLLSKNSAKAVFPCGSGLLWRRIALDDIGGFPAWNIVEDFQSGIEALRRGWESEYIPIVGAVGQVAPEDIPNLYKQRGTWALDAFRFLFWGKKKGLNIRQWLHFIEPAFFYLTCIFFYLQAIVLIATLFSGVRPIISSPFAYFIHIFPHILSVFLVILSLIRRRGISFKDILRGFQIAFGLGPVYLKAFFFAIFWGPNKKPKYIVTRKEAQSGLFIPAVFPQLLFVFLILLGIIYTFSSGRSLLEIDFVTIGWGIFYICSLQKIVRNSWFTFKPIKSILAPFTNLNFRD